MEKHLYFSKLTEKEQRMVMDDDFFDVTKDDVKRLIHRMKIHLFPNLLRTFFLLVYSGF